MTVENRGNEHTLIESAILYADRGDRRKSQSLHRTHLAIFADSGDRRVKSASVSLALAKGELEACPANDLRFSSLPT